MENPEPTSSNEKRRSWPSVLMATLFVLAITILAIIVARRIPVANHFFTDADTIRESLDAADTRQILWQPPEPLADVINTQADDYEPRISADGLTLYFVRGKAGGAADIYTSTRILNGWTDPQPLVGVNSRYDELGPEPSPDTRSLYFYSDRPGGSGGYDLWVVDRNDDGWQTPTNLGPAVNSEYNDYGISLTPGGDVLYFASNRPNPQGPEESARPDPKAWSATLREDLHRHDYDLYSAPITEIGVGEAKALTALNTPYNDGAPAVSSFGDFLYFSSDRTGGEGGFDVYRSRRIHGAHASAENLGPSINTRRHELDPGLSLGGYALFFSSDRPMASESPTTAGATTGPEDLPKYNLFYTTSREVFAKAEYHQRPRIDWAALWRTVGPNLLWALLAATLILSMLTLFGGVRGRSFSLLAKCLLGSVTAHLLLLLIFNVWQVTSSLAREFQRRGKIQIALASPSTVNDLARQIRGNITEVAAPSAQTVSDQRQEPERESKVPSSMASISVEQQTLDMPDDPTIDIPARDTTIERHVERPVPPDTALSDSTPAMLKTKLPAVPQPVQTQESRPADQMQRAQVETVTRATAREPFTQIHAATAEMTPDSHAGDAQASAVESNSMADAAPTHEATPDAAPTSMVDESAASQDRPAAPPIRLSSVRAEPIPQTDEAAPTMTSIMVPTPRHHLAQASPATPTKQRLRRIRPAAVPVAKKDATLADRPDTADAEHDAALASIDPFNAAALDMSAARLTDFGLADVEETKIVMNDAEAPSPPTPVHATEFRHVLSSAISSDRPKPSAVSVAPKTIPSPRGERSLAPEPMRRTADATPMRVQREPTSRPPTAAAELPDIGEFALPDVAQASADSESRKVPAVTPVKTVLRRASIDRDVMVDASPSSMTWLDVPTQVRRKSDGNVNRLAKLTARDIELKQMELLPQRSIAFLRDVAIPETETPEFGLPTDLKPPTNAYAQRSKPDRMDIVEQKGGSKQTERAVANALRWLANHQSEDGRWSGGAFDDGCGKCGGETDVVVDHAITGLSLLAFLGAGHTHETDGPYRDNVRRAVRWLLDEQADDGDLRGDETMYSHGIATIALSEAYGMTGDTTLLYAVQRAVEFIDGARNRSEGGWRYDPGQAGDTSVLGWQVMALKSAALNRIPVSIGSLRAAKRWMDSVDQFSTPGLYAYRPDRRHTPSMTAEGMFVQQLLGVPRDDPRMRNASGFVAQHLPDWESQPNTYYWYYATLALFQHQGNKWLSWNQALTRELLRHQRKDAAALGSWNPEGEWADVGGRVYQTAICALMLEVYYRYLPLYARDKTFDPIGAIRGHITDASTDRPIEGATIRLDVSDRLSVSVTSDENGAYLLLSPDVPKYFALSASNPGYIPSTSNVASATVKGTTFLLDFVLQPESPEMVAMESDPAVHHLGDDNYGGLINSRFQNKSEGSWYAAGFELDESQVGPNIAAARIHVLVKGIQRRHRIRVNGTVLERRLDQAPSDGKFGEFTAEFDPSLLRAGKNEFEIIAKPSTSDIDDFEFVNVRIRLALKPEA